VRGREQKHTTAKRNDTQCASVKGKASKTSPNLSGRVPNLQFDCLLINVHGAKAEIDTDRGNVIVRKRIVGETQQQARLADTCAAHMQTRARASQNARGYNEILVERSTNARGWLSKEGSAEGRVLFVCQRKWQTTQECSATERTRVANDDELKQVVIVTLLRCGHG
jgi:hypothetical protein